MKQNNLGKNRLAIATRWVGLTVLMLAGLQANAASEKRAQDMDDLSKEWSYLLQTTTVIGTPFAPNPVQVTYDGSIFTGEAETAFFYGENLSPINIRQRHFLEGWIPIVQDDWVDGELSYSYECFGASLEPLSTQAEVKLGHSNSIQFAKLRVENNGTSTTEAVLASAVRGSGEFYRKGGTPANTPRTRYDIESSFLFRNGKALALFDVGAEIFAVPGVPYTAAYTADEHNISPRAETGLHIYRKTLKPGESFEMKVVIPRVPIPREKMEWLSALRNAKYDTTRQDVIDFWRELLDGEHTTFEIPEARVQDSWRAALVHLILATRQKTYVDSKAGVEKLHGKRQGSGLPYDGLFLNDYFDMRAAYDVYGLHDYVKVNVPWLTESCLEDGMLIDRSLSHGKKILASHGQGLYSLAHHYIMTRDLEYAKEVYPKIKLATEWIIKCHEENEYGLMIPSIPYDNEMIKGHYTSHNLHALLGMRTAIRVARDLGETADAERWTERHASYEKAVLKGIDWTVENKGYVAPGLYEYLTGEVSRAGFAEYRTNQDWENNLLVYPNEVLEVDDPRVALTLKHIRDRKYREGCMTYRYGQHIHQYITINQAHQYMVIGDQKNALLDMYHVLLHNGPTHDGFENLVVPWSRQVSQGCPPPHAWAAAKTALFIRNMMIHEMGGKAGLHTDQRDLRLFSLISPDWVKPGNELRINKARTEMGLVSASMRFTEGGALVRIDPTFAHTPRHLVLRVPYFVELESVNAKKSPIVKGDLILLDPSVREVTLNWKMKPDAFDNTYQDLLMSYRSEYGHYPEDAGVYERVAKPKGFLLDEEKEHPPVALSFDVIRDAYRHEYIRRAEESKQAMPRISAPELIADAAVRKELYGKSFAKRSLTTGKPVTSSEPQSSSSKESAQCAVDGQTDARKYGAFRTKNNKPGWVMVDLEKVHEVSKIGVYSHYIWAKDNAQSFSVETSVDGKKWITLIDKSDNTEIMTKKGYLFSFQPTDMRYIRVNLIKDSKGQPLYLTELTAE